MAKNNNGNEILRRARAKLEELEAQQDLFQEFNFNNRDEKEKLLDAINEHIQMEEFLILKACDLNLNTTTGLNILQ